MLLRDWYLQCASLALAAVLTAGCNTQPPAGPVAVRVVPAAAAPAPQAASSPSTAAPLTFPPTSGGFSLPIGADIPPAAAADAAGNSTGKASLTVPPLDQQPPQPSPTASSPAAGQGPSIQLSAGIAVPQYLPTGTAMGISVDYSLRAELKGSSQYVWIVKSATGEIVSEVKLESSGNLSAFFQQLKPEHRPFSVRIEAVIPGSKRRTLISNELPLQTNY